MTNDPDEIPMSLEDDIPIMAADDFDQLNSAIQSKDKASIRKWWHQILRTHGRYSCYSIFLTLPSDQNAIHYLTKYAKELNAISNNNCLVIALSKSVFKRTEIDIDDWCSLADEQSSEGYSVVVAQLFDIEFTQFPCLLIFQDIHSSNHIAISLKGLKVKEIAIKMRSIFSVIDKSVRENKKPLAELEKQKNIEFLYKTSEILANKTDGLIKKTFEIAIEAWVKSKFPAG